MKNYLFHIGIDISKLTLDVNLLNSETLESEHFKIENTPKAIKCFLKSLEKRKIELNKTLFCCENTGIYTNHLSFVLPDLELDLWIVPAVEIKRSKGISRGKNDKTDAKDIAMYSYRNLDKLNLFTLVGVDIQRLKILYTEREKQMKSLLLMDTTKENEGFVAKEIYKEVSSINKSLTTLIKKSIAKIEARIKEIIKSNLELKKQSELLKSVVGIGEQTSVYLIIATKGFTAFKTWRQFACYAGIAPFEYSSGTSIKGRTKVNHMADKKIKSLLQMCVMSAIKYDSQLKEYYEKKIKEGKNSMLVMNNIRCKIISRAFATVNRGTPFINTYKFAS